MAEKARVLIYSHDSFGLGHIRRCRTLAHGLAGAFRGLEVLIISGSPIIGSFEFKARVDFVRVPGLIKLRNGAYESLSRHRSVVETTQLRAAMISETALHYRPDIVIVDKEPLGLRGELEGTLSRLKDQGGQLILGLRDVMDESSALAEEWTRKRVFPALETLFDEIWIYGPEGFYDPLAGLPVSQTVRSKITYTGYLRRAAPVLHPHEEGEAGREPRILVTPGGGGDGAQMVESVIQSYELTAADLPPALIVFGPFMPAADRKRLADRCRDIAKLDVMTFDARIERHMSESSGLVAMGGYNTFCEILSFDRPAVILPRTTPRKEQWIRATRAAELGLCRFVDLPSEGLADAQAVAVAIKGVATQPPPSAAQIPGLLNGLDTVTARLRPRLEKLGVAA